MSRRIDHVEHGWPEATGRRRVLVENPDLSAFELRTQVLREAGYTTLRCARDRKTRFTSVVQIPRGVQKPGSRSGSGIGTDIDSFSVP